MIIFILGILTLSALIFIPLSPLVILATALLIKFFENNDYAALLSKKGNLISFLITVVVVMMCLLVANALPYTDYYSAFFKRLCVTFGVVNIYFITKVIVIKYIN